ncbi:HRDC domain-containing protein, partial [Dactylosporangium salmoneum]|uniref:HRDC domain-containing protein n=1 Tax=Dactylosporangium salmoneum TaxID=53361 RepID=UPI003CD0767D
MDPSEGAGRVAHDPTRVFERLRAWRTSVARADAVPPYVIFRDATLHQIAAEQPRTLADLARINGVGGAKLTKFGDQILATLAELDGDSPAAPARTAASNASTAPGSVATSRREQPAAATPATAAPAPAATPATAAPAPAAARAATPATA